jgi:TonB family protein
MIVAVAAAGFAFTPALAQDRDPDWLKKPSAEDLFSVWPTAAWERGEGGKASIRCTITIVGALRGCTVLSETPAGSGFGVAALALAPQFVMRPAMKDGKPVEAQVNIPIAFAAPGKRLGSRLLGQEGGQQVRMIRNIRWLEAPSVADVQAAEPPKARADKTTGHVALQCALDKAGRLGDCETTAEEPRGYGFGAAARRLLPKFRGPEKDSQGGSIAGARVQVSFTFAPETLDAAAPLIGRPDWTGLPAPEDLRAALPEAAKKAGVMKARVVMTCTVAADGSLSGCQTRSEDPPGLGYGAATVALARTFRLSIWSAEGLPTVGGQVNVPIRYDFTDPPAKP